MTEQAKTAPVSYPLRMFTRTNVRSQGASSEHLAEREALADRGTKDYANAALELQGISKRFGEKRILDELELSVPKGAFLSIFGPNGAGKTTLLEMMATLAKPAEGTILIDGIDAVEQPEEARRRIGLVSHSSLLYPDLNAEENLLFFAKLHGVPDARKRCLELLEQVGLKHRRLDTLRTFSRGMTQRLSIARALIGDAPILLLDEPYSGLDLDAAQALDAILESERRRRTIVMVSHDLERGLGLCSHALILANGGIGFLDERANIDAAEFQRIYRETCAKGGK